MVLAVYFSAAWLAVGLTVAAGRRRPRQELAFLLLFFVTVNTQLHIFFDDLFGWLAISKEPSLFASFLIYRSAIVPFVLTAAYMGFDRNWIWLGVLAGGSVLALADAWSEHCKIVTYSGWNAVYAGVYFGLLQCAGIAALVGFRRLRS